MEGFCTPQFTKRTTSASCQAPPHRPEELLLLSPTRATLHRLHTPQAHQISHKLPPLRLTQSLLDCAPKACKASDPQACMNSTGLGTSGLPGQQSTGPHDLCSARPTSLQPAKPETYRHTQSLPEACQAGNPQAHTSLLGHTPQPCHVGNPQSHILSTPLGSCPSGTPGPHSKGLLDCLNDRPPPQAHGTPPPCHPPQKGSKPA
jgi:hypothetical protein